MRLGVRDYFNSFVSTLRADASIHYCRLAKEFLTYVAFQINIQSAFAVYFHSISIWRNAEKSGKDCARGLALRMMYDVQNMFRYRDSIASKGLPDISADSLGNLFPLVQDVNAIRLHLIEVAEAWKRDIDTIYFEKVPNETPASEMLQVGVQMVKLDTQSPWEPDFGLQEPVPLALKPVVDEKALKKAAADAAALEKKASKELALKEVADRKAEASAAKAEGGGGGFFGWGKKGTPADSLPPASAPPASAPGWGVDGSGGDGTGGLSTAAQTDEEMARELQRRLNAGEDL